MSIKSDSLVKPKSAIWLITALLLLSFIPLIGGAFRLTELAGGPEIIPSAARFTASPLPVVLHILSATVYGILGAFQFAPNFRRKKPGWHRMAGRLLVLSGLIVGLSGLWMTLFYSIPYSGELLYVFRLLFGSAMVASILIGLAAILRGDVKRHLAWMARGYAIGLGAGTQALTEMIGEMIFGPTGELSKALYMGAGWVINLAIVEMSIRRRSAKESTYFIKKENI